LNFELDGGQEVVKPTVAAVGFGAAAPATRNEFGAALVEAGEILSGRTRDCINETTVSGGRLPP